MPIDRLRGMSAISSDRELNDDSNIPEWKKMLIMKKRAERLTSSETNKTNASSDALRTVAPPLAGDKAGFKGVYPATCDVPPSSHSERHHEEIKTLKNSPPSIQSDASNVKPIDDVVESPPPFPLPLIKHGYRRPTNVSRRPKMGEDKNLANLDRTDSVDGVPAYPGHPTYRPDDEDERDLQYGPGIVNKLKSRFINMTLKESIKSPAVDAGRIGMRRYSSLENLLEKENCLRFNDYTSKGRLSAPISRTKGKYTTRNINFKRAKSMETLFVEHERQLSSNFCRPNKVQRPASVAGHLPESPLINENLIIVECTSSCKEMEAGKYVKPTRQVSLSNAINEEELPKPDTVKTYKRMFEPADSKTGHAVRRKPPVVRASTKAASAVSKPTGPKHNTAPNSKRLGRTVPPVLNGYQPAKVSAKEPSVESGDAMNGESKPIIVENGMPPEAEEIIDISDKTEIPSIVETSVISVDGEIPSPTSPPPPCRDLESPETEEETEVLKPSTLLGNRQTLWQKPPSSTTSIVFDFRGKDVKPNIGLNPTPFGCKPAHVVRKKRSGSPPRIGNKDGFPFVNGSINGDDGYGDDDDSGIGADLPQNSGIIFEGENIKVGRGSLLNTRNKKLRIQFNDTATSTFEYPSEASLLENSPSPNSPNESSQIEYENSTAGNALLRPSVLGSSGGLANYTPTMLTETDTFRLGVTRPVYRESDTSPKQEVEPANSQEELLKPADPEDMSSWSSSSTTSDLLF